MREEEEDDERKEEEDSAGLDLRHLRCSVARLEEGS